MTKETLDILCGLLDNDIATTTNFDADHFRREPVIINPAANLRMATQPQRHQPLLYGTERTLTMAKKKEKQPTEVRAKFNGMGKCAYIDSLFSAGGHTMQGIHDLAMAAFPSSDSEKMMNNIRVRPYVMRGEKRQASWVKEAKVKKTPITEQSPTEGVIA